MPPFSTRMPIPTPAVTYDLTVVTVCRNVLAELQKTLPSVLEQKAKGSLRIEHLVIDGASTDGTPEWLAGQKEQGRIEAYLSEPDAGIYDAMNKGIALARGRVITFMNAGDCYHGPDIACCVSPILKGEVRTAVGTALYYRVDGSLARTFRPDTQRAYLDTVGCHQAYFFDTAATRRLGGYDAAFFRSAGDLELMNAFLRQYGMPFCSETVVAEFYQGGFSTNCRERFRHEFVELQWRSWEQFCERCRHEPRFAEISAAELAGHCLVLGCRSRSEREPYARQQDELRRMIATLPLPKRSAWRRPCLKAAWGLAFRSAMPDAYRHLLLRVINYLCTVTDDTPYAFYPSMAKTRRPLPMAVIRSLLIRCKLVKV